MLQLGVVVLCLLPLSMIKSMDSLKFASTVSMFFMSAFAVLQWGYCRFNLSVLRIPRCLVYNVSWLCTARSDTHSEQKTETHRVDLESGSNLRLV